MSKNQPQTPQITPKYQDFPLNISPAYALENLDSLMTHGLKTITPLITHFENLIYGDSSDII